MLTVYLGVGAALLAWELSHDDWLEEFRQMEPGERAIYVALSLCTWPMIFLEG
jgi:hypothetical protein